MKYEELKKRAAAQWAEFEDPARARILIGTGTCGRAAGAEQILRSIRAILARLDIRATVSETGCIGLCYAEPLVEMQQPDGPRVLYGGVQEDMLEQLLTDFFRNGDPRPDVALATTSAARVDGIPALYELPMLRPQVRVVLRNCGIIDPESLEHYIARGGYEGLRGALRMEPEQVIEEVKSSGLRGRGGAGFPTGVKWEFCRRAPGEQKYMICNADEGDPGAFMDRSVIESDPHAVLEGMLIAAYAIGAGQGYVYVRAEYPLAVERLEKAIAQAEACGLLGDGILDAGFNFRLRIKKGAGAFVCGAETAMLASLEGRRGTPRPRPPFPAHSGLYDCPTNINNVETLANVPVILRAGSAQFASHGTADSRGTKTFALAGKVCRTGLVEVPLGISLRQIVFEIGGGIPDGRAFKAVQTGGPSGGCIPANLLDLPVDYQRLAEVGAIMGSGGMVVMDEDTCMVDIARYFVDFTQKESCGKCVPCRLGTRQMLQILQDITSGKARAPDLALLREVGEAVKAGSLCGLGQTAPNPVLTTLRYFREEYDAHVIDGCCPAHVCAGLLSFRVDAEKCVGCTACAKVCPVNAITGKRKKTHTIDQTICISCGACFEVCKFDAVMKG